MSTADEQPNFFVKMWLKTNFKTSVRNKNMISNKKPLHESVNHWVNSNVIWHCQRICCCNNEPYDSLSNAELSTSQQDHRLTCTAGQAALQQSHAVPSGCQCRVADTTVDWLCTTSALESTHEAVHITQHLSNKFTSIRESHWTSNKSVTLLEYLWQKVFSA